MREKQSKAIQERHSRMLEELLKLPGNDCCADCRAKNPRWASYSLGIFLCIRCASLHRKMGTHISKVKSVSMDRWSQEEIQNMKNLGGNNARNSEINKNPQKYSLPVSLDDDIVMEKYIRDKWERKLFMKDDIKQLSISSTLSSTSSLEELSTPTNANSITSSPKQMAVNNPSIFHHPILTTTPSLTNSSSIRSFSSSSQSTISLAGQTSMIGNYNNSNPFNTSPKMENSMAKNPYNPFNNVTQAFPSSNNPFSNLSSVRNNNYNPFKQ